MLHILPDRKNHAIKKIHAYTFLKYSTIGFSSCYFTFSRNPRLPIGILEIKGDPPRENQKAYLRIWKYKMQETYQTALAKPPVRKEKGVQRKFQTKPC